MRRPRPPARALGSGSGTVRRDRRGGDPTTKRLGDAVHRREDALRKDVPNGRFGRESARGRGDCGRPKERRAPLRSPPHFEGVSPERRAVARPPKLPDAQRSAEAVPGAAEGRREVRNARFGRAKPQVGRRRDPTLLLRRVPQHREQHPDPGEEERRRDGPQAMRARASGPQVRVAQARVARGLDGPRRTAKEQRRDEGEAEHRVGDGEDRARRHERRAPAPPGRRGAGERAAPGPQSLRSADEDVGKPGRNAQQEVEAVRSASGGDGDFGEHRGGVREEGLLRLGGRPRQGAATGARVGAEQGEFTEQEPRAESNEAEIAAVLSADMAPSRVRARSTGLPRRSSSFGPRDGVRSSVSDGPGDARRRAAATTARFGVAGGGGVPGGRRATTGPAVRNGGGSPMPRRGDAIMAALKK